ncbi:MAG TPA: metallophosphoesterase family protein [Ktedonobacterales bacterium]|nr:metallophosphoesterase family protein [Ktedonobacterales bacterium]
MRIAVMSDIHGNCYALDALLADLRQHPADQLVCLGDAVQGGAQPAQTVARLRELGCPVVMGNADAWLLTGVETSPNEIITERGRITREWSLAQLAPDDRAFIAAFAPTVELALEGGRRLLCCHGSPTSFDDLIFPETPQEQVERLLGPFAPAIVCGGHTHIQYVRRFGAGMYFNPGSVGLVYERFQPGGYPKRFDAWAEYAVLSSEGDRLALEFRRVPYDVAALRATILASGHPYAAVLAEEYGGEKS